MVRAPRDVADCNTDDWRYSDGDGADVIVIPVLYYLRRRHDLSMRLKSVSAATLT